MLSNRLFRFIIQRFYYTIVVPEMDDCLVPPIEKVINLSLKVYLFCSKIARKSKKLPILFRIRSNWILSRITKPYDMLFKNIEKTIKKIIESNSSILVHASFKRIKRIILKFGFPVFSELCAFCFEMEKLSLLLF